MLIRPRPPGPSAPPDAVDLLLACHERIRRFTALALRLGEAEAPASERAEAASAVRRYFQVALPLHVADEDHSVRPRLLAAGAPAQVAEALCAMAEEHGPIEALIAEATPLWTALAEDPGAAAGQGAALVAAGRRLEEHFQAHLDPEEALIFPALRRHLPPAALAEIVAEMRARRA